MVSIEWKNLCYSVGDKQILNNVSGRVGVSETLALLGPSGSGKTSLMNVLTGKVRQHGKIKISGTIILNDKIKHDASTWAFASAMELISLVEQYDIMIAMVTLAEHMKFHADLRLWHLSPVEREKRIEAVLFRLRLLEHKDTLIPKLSGGQKKRVSVAEELLNNPEILILDEPTSGLDSTMAREVCEIFYNRDEKTISDSNEKFDTFKKIERTSDVEFDNSGKAVRLSQPPEKSDRITTTILFCIHQPSSSVYSMFTDVIYLAQGYLIYCGRADGVVPVLENKLEIKCPACYNGAEFALDVINEPKYMDILTDGASKKKTSHKTSQTEGETVQRGSNNNNTANEKTALLLEDEKTGEGDLEVVVDDLENLGTVNLATIDENATQMEIDELIAAKRRALWCIEYVTIARRALIARIRSTQTTHQAMLSATITIVILGMVYWRLSRNPGTVVARSGALMIMTSMPIFQEIMNTATPLVIASPVLAREFHGKRLYRLSSFYLATTTGELPVQFIFPCIYALIGFFMMGFYSGSETTKIFPLLGILLIGQQGAQGLGYFIGSLTITVEYVFTLITCIMVPMLSMTPQFMGTGVALPVYLKWFPYVSVFRWVSEPLMIWCWEKVQLYDWNPNETDREFYISNLCMGAINPKNGKPIHIPEIDSNPLDAGATALPNPSVVCQRLVYKKSAADFVDGGEKGLQTLNEGHPYILIDGYHDVLLRQGIDIRAEPERMGICIAVLIGYGLGFRLLAFLRFYFRYAHLDSCSSLSPCCRKKNDSVLYLGE